MNEQQFFDALRRKLEWPDLGPETDLANSDMWDSLAHLNTVMFVQEEFGETLSADALAKVTTGGELAGLVRGDLS